MTRDEAEVDSATTALERVELLGVPIHATTFDAALQHLDDCVRNRRGTFFCNANVYSLMLARDDAAHRARMQRAGFVMPDGTPIVWLLRWLGHRVERVHGDDFMLAWCEHFPTARHFLLGGADGQPESVAEELRRRFPGIQIVGVRSTPVRPVPADQAQCVATVIHAVQADVIWVGMGTPDQDQFMDEHAAAFAVPMVGVGSLFDLLAGRTRPAPEWMKRSGLQWLFRLAQEPRRLGKRYAYYNTRFLWQAAGLLLKRQP